jgi:predicted secreted acid phosphatase
VTAGPTVCFRASAQGRMTVIGSMPKTRHRAMVLGSLLAISAAACTTPAQPLLLGSPAHVINVGDTKLAATAYYQSGAYDRDLSIVTSWVGAWMAERIPQVRRPAVVFDIDDTALSNWDVIKANDFGRVFKGPCRSLPDGPCGWVAWDLQGRSPAIPQSLAIFRQARALGAEVFFISGRDESQRAATERNLQAAGYDGYSRLILTPRGSHYTSASNFKAPQRAAIEQAGYTIVANIGDQPSDLAGGHAERTFLLPNPFYRIP